MSPPQVPRSPPAPAPPLPGLPATSTFYDARRANLRATFQLRTLPGHNAAIQGLKDKLGEHGPKSLCVIDLTGPDKPVVAGWEVDRMVEIASMAKLAALYVAFQLREDVRAVAEWSGAREFAKLEAGLRRAWGSAPGQAVKPLTGMPAASLPQLDRIFDVEAFDGGADRYPEFRSSYGASARQGKYSTAFFEELGALHANRCPEVRPPDDQPEKLAAYQACYTTRYNLLAKVAFNELLHLMVGWSDNEAASACISLLGLPFIQAMLVHRGLFADPAGGLWLGGGFRGLAGAAFRPLGPRTKKPVKRPDDTVDDEGASQAGTARNLAILLAALVRGDLLQSGGDLMRASMDFSPRALPTQGPPQNVFLFTGLRPAPRVYLSKIGILGKWHSEGAYALTAGTPRTRVADEPVQVPPDRSFVSVALQAPRPESLTACGQQLEAAIDKANSAHD